MALPLIMHASQARKEICVEAKLDESAISKRVRWGPQWEPHLRKVQSRSEPAKTGWRR